VLIDSLVFMRIISAVSMAQTKAVTCRPFTAEARVSSQVMSLWDLWWTEWRLHMVVSECFRFPFSVSFHKFSTITRRSATLYHRY